MLSGPVGPRGDLFLSILRANMAAAGKEPAGITKVVEAVRLWMEARSQGVPPVEIRRTRDAVVEAFEGVGFSHPQAEGVILPLDNPVVLSMFEADPDKALRKIRVPVLAIYGSKDAIIAPALSVDAAVAALADNPDALVLVVPGMVHELIPARPAVSSAEAASDRTMPVVLETLGYWLGSRLKRQ